ncbi:hypothetical protein CA598_13660 [Paenibacillus sp. VTT E-133291]|nr:hypothetical protein CA598_13660 [Paenibacillus sp. VTT E-133291]
MVANSIEDPSIDECLYYYMNRGKIARKKPVLFISAGFFLLQDANTIYYLVDGKFYNNGII